MRIFFLSTLIILLVNQSKAQINQNLLSGVWGDVNNEIPENRVSANYFYLEFFADSTFRAYKADSTYHTGTLQKGKWRITNDELIFTVLFTETNGMGKWSPRPTKLLNIEKGTVTCMIKRLSQKELILKQKDGDFIATFNPSGFNYFPKQIIR